MAKKLKLLLLDTDVVIRLFEYNLWEKIIERCEIFLARTVVSETVYFEDADGLRHPIDLTDYEKSEAIKVFDIETSQARDFRNGFDPLYLEKLDPGETDSLVYLLNNEGFIICSADKIVFRVLGNLGVGEQGISLEEVLAMIGLRRELQYHSLKKKYRVEWTNQGFEDKMYGLGRK